MAPGATGLKPHSSHVVSSLIRTQSQYLGVIVHSFWFRTLVVLFQKEWLVLGAIPASFLLLLILGSIILFTFYCVYPMSN